MEPTPPAESLDDLVANLKGAKLAFFGFSNSIMIDGDEDKIGRLFMQLVYLTRKANDHEMITGS